MTVDDAYRLHREGWDALIEKYGSAYAVPSDEATHQGELTRARLSLATPPPIQACPGRDPVSFLKYYGFTHAFIDAMGFDPETAEKVVKNKDKYKAADTWWRENVGAQVTPQELADAADWSYSTAMNFINDNVTIFFRVKRGLYEVRDPKVERERENQRQVDG